MTSNALSVSHLPVTVAHEELEKMRANDKDPSNFEKYIAVTQVVNAMLDIIKRNEGDLKNKSFDKQYSVWSGNEILEVGEDPGRRYLDAIF